MIVDEEEPPSSCSSGCSSLGWPQASPGPGSARRSRRPGAGESVNICHAVGKRQVRLELARRRQHRQRRGPRRPSGRHHSALRLRAEGRRERPLPRPELERGWASDLGERLRRSRAARTAQPAELQRRRRRGDRLGRQWTKPVPAGRQRLLPGGALPSGLHGDVQRHPQRERLRGRERRVFDGLGRRRRLRLERRERVRRRRGLPHRGERGRLQRRG